MADTEQAQTEQTEQQEENQEQQNKSEVKSAEFAEAVETDVIPGEENLDILLDINMPVTVILGHTEVSFRQLLQLGPGSVLQLDKIIGEPAELYVQDIKFATGDIVVVDGCFAVKVKEILSVDPAEQFSR